MTVSQRTYPMPSGWYLEIRVLFCRLYRLGESSFLVGIARDKEVYPTFSSLSLLPPPPLMVNPILAFPPSLRLRRRLRPRQGSFLALTADCGGRE